MQRLVHDPVIYLQRGVPEIDTNPLTAHLPLAAEDFTDSFKALAMQPDFSKNDRQRPTSIRRLRLRAISHFFMPFDPIFHSALAELATSIHDGYIPRNPLTVLGQQVLEGMRVTLPYKPPIAMIAGFSGMGKSTLLDRILSYLGPQVVDHRCFEGSLYPHKQVVWIRINVPGRCTPKNLCEAIGNYVDATLGTKTYSGAFARMSGSGINQYIESIRKIVTTNQVGALVLDEFQNLSLIGTGAQEIISLLVTLREELGLPIIIVGTFRALRVLDSALSSARRLSEGGYFEITRPESPDNNVWRALCESTWDYQWVRDPADFTDEINDTLYDCSQGITAIMLQVFRTAQLLAMESKKERVDARTIRRAFNERMRPLHPAINALKSARLAELQRFDDLYLNAWPLGPGQDRERGGLSPTQVTGQDGPPAKSSASASTPDKPSKKESSEGSASAKKQGAVGAAKQDEESMRASVLHGSGGGLLQAMAHK